MKPALVMIATTLALWVGFDSSAFAQNSLPDDIRQALPAAKPSKASAPAAATPKVSKPPAAAAAPSDSPTETTEQLLERALLRYRNIIDQGAGGDWEADVTQRLDHLEAILKKLKDEARAAAPAPVRVPKPKQKPAPPPVPSSIVPASAVEPKPSVAAKPTAPTPYVAELPKTDTDPLPASAIKDHSRVETAEELENMAAACQRLAQELQAAAARLRESSAADETIPASSTKR